MKKLSVIGMTLLSIVTLSACATSSNNSSSKSKTENSYPLERYASSSETEFPQKTTAYSDEAYVSFPYSVQADKKNTYTFKSITKVKGNSDEDNILLVDISFTNNEETATTPYMGFAVDWDLQQTNDNKNESLSPVDLKEVHTDANQELVDNANKEVNPGETVDAIVGYRLANNTEDVGFILRSTISRDNHKGFAWSNQ